MPANPKRKLYCATFFEPSTKNKSDKLMRGIRLIGEFATYPTWMVLPQIYFPFDGSIEWLTRKLADMQINAIITEIKPQTFLCTDALPWLYVYDYHKANGYLYPPKVEAQAEAYINLINNKTPSENPS